MSTIEIEDRRCPYRNCDATHNGGDLCDACGRPVFMASANGRSLLVTEAERDMLINAGARDVGVHGALAPLGDGAGEA